MIDLIYKEIYIFYRFCKSNSLATIGPAILIFVSYMLNNMLNNEKIDYKKFLILILYNVFYIYQFDILNQINGIEEDKINKPDRPLASGLINEIQAKKRYIIVICCYLILSYKKNIFLESLLWSIVTILYNVMGLDKNWFLKSLLMSPAIYTLASADYRILYSINILNKKNIIKKVITLSIIGPITIFVQDFRDIKGDLKINRKTLPIKFGLRISRYVCFFLGILSIFIITFIHYKEYIYILSNSIFLIIISLRILLKTTLKDDKLTYNLWCIWYCINYLFIC